jgi:hypothetical protein
MLSHQSLNGGNLMSKTLKWILVVAGFISMIFGGYGYGMMRPGLRMMEPYYYHSPVRSVFGGLLCLGVILLVIVGIVALINALVNKNRPAETKTATQISTQPSEISEPSRNCGNCGKPAQQDWNTCPYCGNPLS